MQGVPSVEVYSVLDGRLQVWFKPMNQRGVRTWRCSTLEAGDWVEIEPLNCHFVCWLGKSGLAAVLRSQGGEGAGSGRLGVASETPCGQCSRCGDCQLPMPLQVLVGECRKPFRDRDFGLIARTAHAAPLML